jgi:hypothetical protein
MTAMSSEDLKQEISDAFREVGLTKIDAKTLSLCKLCVGTYGAKALSHCFVSGGLFSPYLSYDTTS